MKPVCKYFSFVVYFILSIERIVIENVEKVKFLKGFSFSLKCFTLKEVNTFKNLYV